MRTHSLPLTLLALALGCRSRPPAPPPQTAPPAVAPPSPTSPDAATPAAVVDAAAPDDAPENVRVQRVVLRGCPAPAGTPSIVPEPDSYDDVQGPWRPDARRAPANLPPPVATACAAIEARRRAALARLGQAAANLEGDAHVESVGRCHDAGRGAWVLEPGAARMRNEPGPADEPERHAFVAWTLAYIAPDGQVTRFTMPAAQRGARAWWRVFHDFDGDGVAEAGLHLHGQAVGATLYTVRGGAITPYAPAAGLDAERPVDVDQDGRPDLLLDSPFSTPNTCGPSVFYGVPEVAHALADGSFSRDDAVAREWMRQRCAGITPAAADRLLEGGSPSGELVGLVGCLRYIGVGADALVRALDAQWPEGADDHCWSRPDVLRSAREARVAFQVPACAVDPSGR